MDSPTQARYQARAKIIKALAHPTRLFIVDQIAKQERCVCELTALIGADMSTVSKHLGILKEAGVVSDEKRGLMVYYRLRVPCILNIFGCIEGVLKANAETQIAAM